MCSYKPTLYLNKISLSGKDSNGKKLYGVLTSNMHKTGMDEEQFLNHFCYDILEMVDTNSFEESLKKILL